MHSLARAPVLVPVLALAPVLVPVLGLVFALAVAEGCAKPPPPVVSKPAAPLPTPPGCPRAATLDAAAITRELACLLSRYVQLDTTNPPGHEIVAARFLRDVLARDGIDAQIVETAPDRANVYARLKGSGQGKALVLVHHMDVVPASAEEWSVPPLSGRVKNGELWGRGAIDNKGSGVMALMATLMLKRLGTAPPRDVILLGVADEEAGSAHGARWLMEHRFDLFEDAGFVLNEGGSIVEGGDGRAMARVELAQKAPLWLRVTARGRSGHGSTPRPDAAPAALVRALSRLEAHRFPVKVVPAVQAVFAERAKAMPADARAKARPVGERAKARPVGERAAYADLRAALKKKAFRDEFLADPRQAALVQNTLSITMLSGSDKENVVPPTASAVLDMRLLPGEDAATVIEEVERVMAEPAVEVETLLSWQAQASSRDTPLFAAIEAMLAERHPGTPVTGNVIGGFTDCNTFRTRGLTCYGFVPARMRAEDLHRIHGKDERVALDALANGVADLVRLIELFN